MALLFVVVQAFAVGVLFAVGLDVDVDDALDTRGALVLVAVQLAGIAAVALLVATGASSWRRLGVLDQPAGSFGAGMRLLAPVGLLVVAPSLLFALFAGDPLLADHVTVGSGAALLALAIAIGVNEELWFRGLVVDRLQQARRPWLTVFAASVLFGLPHLSSGSASIVNAIGVTLAVAVPFTVVRMTCSSLWSMVAWHAIIDAWAFLHTSTVVATGSYELDEALVALVLPAALAVGYARWFVRRRAALTP